MDFFGIKLVGVTPENGRKLLLTLAVIGLAVLLRIVLNGLARFFLSGRRRVRTRFWTHQGIALVCAAVLVLSLLSVWFEDPARLTTFLGLFTAGLAFALQRVITALAGYFVILRGKTFSVGDRIMMGGVRGDVIALGFIQTTIMEMGQSPAEQADQPAMWVKSRQFTGRIVTVTNDKVFDEPIYNYTHDFPYIWEEMTVPIRYDADMHAAEQILLESARKFSLPIAQLSEPAVQEMKRRYSTDVGGLEPKVYLRMTDNWLELTVRFLIGDHGSRDVKDAMCREILPALRKAGIDVASATYEIVGLPRVHVEIANEHPRPALQA